jgi:ABC-2 type transport system permease protein
MSAVALAAHQFRYDQRVFWRRPSAVFFTVLFPLMFLFVFVGVFGNDEVEGTGVNTSTYYVPAIITLAVISATTQSLAIRLTQERDAGLLKRVRGTPLPPSAFIAGRVGNAAVVSVLMVLLVGGIGKVIWGVDLPTTTLPALLLTLAVGVFAFCCLGFALCALIPNEDAAPPITNVALFPLYFLSGIFIPESEIPDGVLRVADAFPIRHFFEAFFTAWDPSTTGAGFELGNLAVVLAWGLAALGAALLAFRWEPRR